MLTLIGILAGTLFMSLMAGIAIGRTLFRGDRSDQLTDNAAEQTLFVGDGFNRVHAEPTTERSRYDHQ